MSDSIDRRKLLALGGSAPLMWIGGKRLIDIDGTQVDKSARSHVAELADMRASSMSVPPNTIVENNFPIPTPAPGGQIREYWVQASSLMWNLVPTGHDDWMDEPVHGPTTFRAYAYQSFSPGFATPTAPPSIPGPLLSGEVGDVLKVHFRNGDTHFNQGITMHPHGVRYNPDYEGAYLGKYTHVGGFIAPQQEFTYYWECVPESVGVWPYHDHGPNELLNVERGLFGPLIVRPKGAMVPDVENFLFFHSVTPDVANFERSFMCINGHAYAGNTPTITAAVGQKVAFHVIGADANFHTFHIHGHRWVNDTGHPNDNPNLGPFNGVTANFVEDNMGRWLYHCHVGPHMMMGMAGWYIVTD